MASSSLRGVSLSLSFRTASKSAHSFQELCPFIRFRARGRPAWGGARPRFLSSGLRDFLEVEEGPQTEAVDTAKRFGMYPISNRSRLVKIAVVGTDGVLARKEVRPHALRM